MIKTWLLTGDKHGDVYWPTHLLNTYNPEETAIIILGDAGINFYLNKTDTKHKRRLEDTGFTFYCVRGNHEARPADLLNIRQTYDYEVCGPIWYEPEYPHIKYFLDYGVYKINGYYTLVIGGAYSVDKFYRLERAGLTEETNIPTKSGWWNNEQLSAEEWDDCFDTLHYHNAVNHIIYDFVLTHTCPISYEPTDLFLSFIDQDSVDKTMEKNLEIVKNNCRWRYWLFGHYHADRIEAPHVEQLYHDIENIEDIVARWKKYDETGELDWWLDKGPKVLDPYYAWKGIEK